MEHFELTTSPAAVRWLLDELGRNGLDDFVINGRRLTRVGPNGEIINYDARCHHVIAALATKYVITRHGREQLMPQAIVRAALARLSEASNLRALHEHPSRTRAA